jgi:hypothetical protein
VGSSRASEQALGDGPIAQGLASAVNSLGGLLQPAGYRGFENRGQHVALQPIGQSVGFIIAAVCCLCLQESGYQDGGSEGFGYSSSSSYAAPTVSHVTASQVRAYGLLLAEAAAAAAALFAWYTEVTKAATQRQQSATLQPAR